MTNSPPPGWHPDPSNPNQLRWWDGTQWTHNTHPIAGGQGAAQSAQPASQPRLQGFAEKTSSNKAPGSGYNNPSRFREARGRKPTVGGAALIGIIVMIATTIVVGIYLALVFVAAGAIIGPSLDNPPGYALPVLSLFGIGAVVLSLWFSGWLTSLFFNSNGYKYSSRWNLAVAYPVAGLITAVIAALLNVVLLFIVFGSEQPPGGLMMILIFIVYVFIMLYFLGKSIGWASGWSKTTAIVLIVIYLLLSSVGALLTSSAIIAGSSFISGLGDIGGISASSEPVSRKQVNSIKVGTSLATVKKRLGKPAYALTAPIPDIGEQTCLSYEAKGAANKLWQFCFDGAGPKAKLKFKALVGADIGSEYNLIQPNLGQP